MTETTVADVIGATVAALGIEDAFGVIGSGNLVMAEALCHGGARFHHARHEGGAICMADGYARVTGRVGICTVHQGPGLTNAMTGLTEAVKSHTPLLVLAGETPAAARTSNFRIDQHGLIEAVGARAERIHDPDTAADDVQRAYVRAGRERRPVVVMAPIDVQAEPATQLRPSAPPSPPPAAPAPDPAAINRLADLLIAASRPAIIAGRGAVAAHAGAELQLLGQLTGGVLATSAPANGLFAGDPFALGIAGGFASPLAAELFAEADLVLAFGASLNHWTTRHGALIGPQATVVQIDLDPAALGRHRPVQVAIVGDARLAATALAALLTERGHAAAGFRSDRLAAEIASRRWAREPYEDASTEEFIDPRTLSIALDRALPARRAVAVDSGHFTGYPAMYLGVGSPRDWLFVNGFQSVGLGLGNAIGAAVAQPDVPTVAALGDGGAFMALAELETAVRLKLGNLLIIVYDDAAYGAEVHHFEAMGRDVSPVKFPDADLAAIARAAGARAATVRRVRELSIVEEWLQAQTGHPLLLDAKVNPAVAADWLQEAFRSG